MAIFQAMIQALYLELWLLLVLISVHHRYPTVRRQVDMFLFHPLITPLYIQRPLCDLDTLERSFIGLASFLELVNCQVLIIMCLQMQEFITSATTLGALLGSLAAGVMSDWTGRKPVLGIADIIFIGGAIAQAVCHGVWSMVCPPSVPISRH